MTTAAEIRKLAKPLLERNPDLVLVGRFVFFKQIDHFLRGVYIDRCGEKLAFRPVWTIICLFRPTEQFSVSLGEQIYPAPVGHWYLDNPDIEKKFADSMEALALPKLQAIVTVEDFSKISYQLSSHNIFTLNDSPLRKIYVDLALGNFASAAKILEMFSKQPDYWKERMYTESEFNRLISELFQMVETENKPAIAALLHKWEAYSVKQLKLEKYWQKTPFPIEL